MTVWRNSALALGRYIHLRVEEAGRRFNNADGLIVHRDGVEGILMILQHRNKLQTHILGVHLGAEGVRHGLALACGDLN